MIRQPTPWRMVNLAFAIWAANFLIVYAVALVNETGSIAKAVAIGLGVASIFGFVIIWRWAATRDEARMVQLAVAVAGVATLFNALIVIA